MSDISHYNTANMTANYKVKNDSSRQKNAHSDAKGLNYGSQSIQQTKYIIYESSVF